MLDVDVFVTVYSKAGVTVAFEKPIMTYGGLYEEAKATNPQLVIMDLGSNDSKRA